MTTQLRLVEPPEPRAKGPKAHTRSTRPARVAPAARSGRRAVAWGDWHLDARTRRVGRAGVAAAREALEAVADDELSRAS